MSIFKGIYGVLTLNAMKDLVNEYGNLADENPCIEWNLTDIRQCLNNILEKAIETSRGAG